MLKHSVTAAFAIALFISATAAADVTWSNGGEVESVVDWQEYRPGGSAAVGGPSGSASGRQVCEFAGKTIDCTPKWGGAWSPSRKCYVIEDFVPRPKPAGETSGKWYRCIGNFIVVQGTFWLSTPPATGPPPSVVAGQAVANLQLQPINIGITPKNGGKGLVGLPTWLWADNPQANTWGPITNSGTSGPVTVSLTAHVAKIVWDMGDGTTITCHNQGTKYQKRFGAKQSPTCGHNYHKSSNGQPGNQYTVRATTYWTVDWNETSGGGQSGQIQLQLENSTTIKVGELQVLVH